MKNRRKKEVIEILPLSVGEVCYITKLASNLDYKIKNGIPNLRGSFSHYVMKDLKPFDKQNISFIKKHFRKEKNGELISEELKEGEFYVLSLSKMA